MSIIEIKSNKLTVGIDTLGSELMYINGESGTEFLWNGEKSVWSYRSPILFPICGGLKNDTYTLDANEYTMPKHGFVRKAEFEGKKISESKAEFIFKSNPERMEKFPFEHIFKTVFEVCDNTLKVSYIVENLSGREMYFSVGAHEGYSCPEGIEEYEVQFDEPQTLDTYCLDGTIIGNKTERVIENSKVLPLKTEYFTTDALIFKNVNFKKVTLAHKNSSKKVVLEFDTPNNFLIWQKPGAKYICLEPWDGISDSVNSDGDITHKEAIVKLGKDKTYTMVHEMKFFE